MFNINQISRSYEWLSILGLLKDLDKSKYPAVCAGGFPRDVGLGTFYNDIDIFVQTKNEKDEPKVKEIFDECYIIREIRSAFQLICVPCDNIVNWINSTFDFTCCLVYIDKDGEIHTNGAQESLKTRKLQRVNADNPLDNLKTVKHCLRLVNRGWSVDISILRALLRTLVPIVGNQTYPTWKALQGTLDTVLALELEPDRPAARPVVGIREYNEPRSEFIGNEIPPQTPTPPYIVSSSFQYDPATLDSLSRALNANPGR